MRTRKSYRFSPRAVHALDGLKRMYRGWTETAIIEAALEHMLDHELFYLRFLRDGEDVEGETDGDQSEELF